MQPNLTHRMGNPGYHSLCSVCKFDGDDAIPLRQFVHMRFLLPGSCSAVSFVQTAGMEDSFGKIWCLLDQNSQFTHSNLVPSPRIVIQQTEAQAVISRMPASHTSGCLPLASQ